MKNPSRFPLSRIGSPLLLASVFLAPGLASAQTPTDAATPSPEPAPTAPEPVETTPTTEPLDAPPAPAPAPSAPAPEPPTAATTTPAPPQVTPPEEPEPPSLTPFRVTTSTWTRFEGRANYDTLGVSRARFVEGDAFFYRARLGFRTNPLELTKGLRGLVQFSPQSSGRLGLNGTTTESQLGIYEGYVRLEGSIASFEAGRFMMNYGDSLVIGNLDWHQAGRAFDGMRSRVRLGEAYVDGFLTLTSPDGLTTAEGHPLVNEPFLAGDSYFWGVYAGLGPLLAAGLDLDAYLLGVSNVATSGLPSPLDPTVTVTRGGATEMTFGARVKQKIDAIDYRLEAGLQFGTRPVTSAVGDAQTIFAYQADGEFGYSFTPRFRLALNGIIASGDDPTTADGEGWHELYPTGHKFLGLMDVIGPRTNVGSGVLKASAGITESLKFLLDAHIFARLEDGGLGQVGTDKFAGYELNTQLVQKLGAPAHVRGLYGVFIPNAGHYASNDPAHYVEIEAGLIF